MRPSLSVTDHLTRVFDAPSIEDIWALHVERMAQYGFVRLLYVFTRFRTANSFGKVDDILVLSNHDQAYLDGYFYSGLCLQAPMLKWAANSVGAQSWRMLADNGSPWFLSGSPDQGWDDDELRELRRIRGADFEAVDVSHMMAGPDSGQARTKSRTKAR